MSKLRSLLCALVIILMAGGCISLVKEFDAIQDQIDALKLDVDKINTYLSSISGIIEELENGAYVKGYEEVKNNDETIGYDLTFSDGRTIRVCKGGDTSAEVLLALGVKQDSDEVWYWTFKGQWLTDPDGNKVRVIGEKGVQGNTGTDGISPKLKIEDGWWYVSYDNGKTWQQLSRAKGYKGSDGTDGADGDSFIKDIQIKEDSVVFLLDGGKALSFPIYSGPLNIVLSEKDITMIPGQTTNVQYTLIGETDNSRVFVKSSPGGWKVKIDGTPNKPEGSIVITAPQNGGNAEIAIWASSGDNTVMSVIKVTTKNYFKITNLTAEEGTIKFTKTGSPDDIILRSSIDGINWTEPQTLTETTEFNLPADGYVMFDGSDNRSFSDEFDYPYNENGKCWTISADVLHEVSGDIMTLVGEAKEVSHNMFAGLFFNDAELTCAEHLVLPALTLAESCYHAMFFKCTGLTTPPKLPATNLAERCYERLFSGCTSLTTAPLLPSTNLAAVCYVAMFEDCTSLKTAPVLPATTLMWGCYNSMFYNCGNLTEAPELPATILADRCYGLMFLGCTSLSEAPALPATTLDDGCYSCMFMGCTNLITAPILPATELAKGCYRGMFSGCSELATAPELIATELAKGCYEHMFGNCAKLNYVKCLATDIRAEDCINDWLSGVSHTGTFVKSAEMNDWTRGPSGIPYGWTVISDGEETPKDFFKITNLTTEQGTITFTKNGSPDNIILRTSTDGITWTEPQILIETTEFTLPAGGYVMFDGADNMRFSNRDKGIGYNFDYWSISADVRHSVGGDIMTLVGRADGLTRAMFYGMFMDDVTLTDASALLLPATEMSIEGYAHMFEGCANLSSAPALPATTLAFQCYCAMFKDCLCLNTSPELPAKTLAVECYLSMFEECISITTPPDIHATTLAESCCSSMFSGCTSLTDGPVLYATTLAPGCYVDMFEGCTSLTSPSALPATTLAKMCYYRMFGGCTSLITAPALPATTLAENCYGSMFSGCSGLKNPPVLPAMNLANCCYYGMFAGCSDLTNPPALPATVLADWCYGAMFNGCNNLTVAPSLPATTLSDYCYCMMFADCPNLNYVKSLATDISPEGCTKDWLSRVSETGTFVKNSDMEGWTKGPSGIPHGWTILSVDEENGHPWVDLGLPSGIKWAEYNIGASSPEEYGEYYTWGETTTKPLYDRMSDKWFNFRYTKYGVSPVDEYNGVIDNKTILEAEDDAARVKWGGNWRIPSFEEFIELNSHCTSEWTTLNGVHGRKYTSVSNGNSIFLPAAGYMYPAIVYAGSKGCYWSSSLWAWGGRPDYSLMFLIDSDQSDWTNTWRTAGSSIRPVTDKGVRVPVEGVSISQNTLTLTKGDNVSLNATVYPANATQKAIIWSSNNPAVAYVDYSGYVSALLSGVAIITATTYDGEKMASCQVTVLGNNYDGDANGHDWVDLGLPSGLKWATCNVGADSPEEYGDYFAWGETSTKTIYSYETYTWSYGNDDSVWLTKYCTSSDYGVVDNIKTLSLSDDAARNNWGGGWRIPTMREFAELINSEYCSTEWTSVKGVYGLKVISKANGNSIFMPAADYKWDTRYGFDSSICGHYYSSTLGHAYYPRDAYNLRFDESIVSIAEEERMAGLTIRPVIFL